MLLCSGSICNSKRIAYLFIYQHGQILIATDAKTDQLSVTNSDGMEYKNLKTYGIQKSTVLKKIKKHNFLCFGTFQWHPSTIIGTLGKIRTLMSINNLALIL